MDLSYNPDPLFTRHVVAHGLLTAPFVVVDVGVLGGENRRWHVLGDALVVHGFDAGAEAIRDLEGRRALGRHYRCLAIGDHDGETEFFYDAETPTSSSLIAVGRDRYTETLPVYDVRRVPMRMLDSLVAAGEISAPDFLKVDVEGAELAVFRGAQAAISSNVLGIEFETSFNISPAYPQTHLATLQQLVLPHGFGLFDLNFNRVPCASFRAAWEAAGRGALGRDRIGRPATFNALYCRDAAATPPAGPDRLLKLMIILELHGLVDVAFDLAVLHAGLLGQRIDVEAAKRLLLDSAAGVHAGWTGIVAEIHASTSWRITAPLRAIKRLITGERPPYK